MRRVSPWIAVCGFGLVSAFVTINVYFPAAAAEKAADRIIEEVWGEDPDGKQPVQSSEPTSSNGWLPGAILARLLDLLVPAASAQQADLDISTPSINSIKASMQARHNQLKPVYDSGAVGLTGDGLVRVRDPKAVPLKDRQRVNRLVADENRDRNALYGEIARANGHPEWEADIRATFARRWIQNARRGWWYRSASGWRQK